MKSTFRARFLGERCWGGILTEIHQWSSEVRTATAGMNKAFDVFVLLLEKGMRKHVVGEHVEGLKGLEFLFCFLFILAFMDKCNLFT